MRALNIDSGRQAPYKGAWVSRGHGSAHIRARAAIRAIVLRCAAHRGMWPTASNRR